MLFVSLFGSGPSKVEPIVQNPADAAASAGWLCGWGSIEDKLRSVKYFLEKLFPGHLAPTASLSAISNFCLRMTDINPKRVSNVSLSSFQHHWA